MPDLKTAGSRVVFNTKCMHVSSKTMSEDLYLVCVGAMHGNAELTVGNDTTRLPLDTVVVIVVIIIIIIRHTNSQ
jgi:hypothetical protein